MKLIQLTGSKVTLIEPTFVAPTAVRLKNPCRHEPIYAARSFIENKFEIQLAIAGFTLRRVPDLKKKF